MIVCTSDTVIGEPKMIAGVASIIVCGREMALCSTKMIADVARIIVSVAEKIESLTELIADGMEILSFMANLFIDVTTYYKMWPQSGLEGSAMAKIVGIQTSSRCRSNAS